MLKLAIIGNLGSDAEVRTYNGASYVTFRVAHTEKWTDRNSGEVHERTEWVSATLDGNGGGLTSYLKRGTKVFIWGDCSTRVFTSSKDGKTYAGLNVRVRQIELCGQQQGLSYDSVKEFIAQLDNDTRTKLLNELPF